MSQKAELAGQIALVTGGSRGIGYAIARSLAEAGAVVAIVARDGERATKAASRLPGSGHVGFPCNVALPAEVVETVAAVKGSIGDVEILVNNAGITRDNILFRIKEEDWDEVIDVNLKGAFNFIKAVSRSMIRRHDGVILNITSVFTVKEILHG